MKDMMQVFLRLMEIIDNKNNCVHHYPPLKKLIHNFNVVYSQIEKGSLKREADAYTYALEIKLENIYEKKLGRKED